MRSLPKSRRQYLEEINFEEFETMAVMLKKELRQPDEKAIKEARLRGLNLQEIGYQEPFIVEVLPDGKFDVPGGDIDDYDFEESKSEAGEESEEKSDNESEEDGDDQSVGEKRDVENNSDKAKDKTQKESDGEAKDSDEEIDTNKSSQVNRYKDSAESQREQFEPICSTDESFRQNETALLDAQCKEYVYVDMPKPILKNILTPYKRVHELLEEHYNLYEQIDATKLYNEF
jgi:hypothetical protein